MVARVAIVGAGPAGCYTALALSRATDDIDIDVIERLVVPFGLIRYGVATDHQSTKAVTRQFERLFERGKARLLAGIEVGRDVTIEELRSRYHATVIATGATADRSIDIPGADLPGVVHAGALTRALNQHPDASALPKVGAHPIIIGAGNVALDVARLLLRDADGLTGSDLGPAQTEWLLAQASESVTVVGRSAPSEARFDKVMLREIAALPDVRVTVDGPPCQGELADVMFSLDGVGGGAKRLSFVMGRHPLRVIAHNGCAAGLEVAGPEGHEIINGTSIIAATGAEAVRPASKPGLFITGWAAGGRGALPEARKNGAAVAASILDELPSLATPILPPLDPTPWSWQAWRRIDAAEKSAASAERVRLKITDTTQLAALAAGEMR